MFEDFTIWNALSRGGVVMIVLLIYSVASVAVVLGKLWRFSAFRKELGSSFTKLSHTVKKSGVDAGLSFCETDGGALARIFAAGHRKRRAGKDEILRAMEVTARGTVVSLERYLGVLGTVGSTAPFVGLFGTVLGIIRAFSALSQTGDVGPSVVADGIAEALIATAGGLVVAIPAVIAYNYFVRAVQRLSVEVEAASYEFVDDLSRGDK